MFFTLSRRKFTSLLFLARHPHLFVTMRCHELTFRDIGTVVEDGGEHPERRNAEKRGLAAFLPLDDLPEIPPGPRRKKYLKSGRVENGANDAHGQLFPVGCNQRTFNCKLPGRLWVGDAGLFGFN